MKVKNLQSWSSPEWSRRAGEIIDIPDEMAEDRIKAGLCARIEDQDRVDAVEDKFATVETPEPAKGEVTEPPVPTKKDGTVDLNEDAGKPRDVNDDRPVKTGNPIKKSDIEPQPVNQTVPVEKTVEKTDNKPKK